MNRFLTSQGALDARNHVTPYRSDTHGNRDTRSRPHPSLSPHQFRDSPSAQNFEGLRNRVSQLTEILNQKKKILDSLVEALSNAKHEESREDADMLKEECVSEEISRLVKRNAYLRHELKVANDKEKRLASDWHVISKQNELKVVQQQIRKNKEDIETLELVRRRRNPKMREIDSEVSQARCLRVKQREYANEAREQLKALTVELRQITKEDIMVHDRCIRLRDQLKFGITVKDLEALKKGVQEQDEIIQQLILEEQKCKRSKEIEREEKYKIIAKEQQECKLLENQMIELQRQLMDKNIELQRSYQFALK